MDDLVERLASMNPDDMQSFCLADQDCEDPAALVLEQQLLDLIGDQLESETFGMEDEETPTERILHLCVEAMDIPTTVGMILDMRDHDPDT